MKKTRQAKGDTRRRKRRKRRLFTPPFFILCMLFFTISAGVSYVYFKPIFAFKGSASSLASKEKGKNDNKAESYPSRLYNTEPLYRPGGVNRSATVVIIEDVIREYLRPYGVRLRDLYIDRQGIVYIDLGKEIIKNFRGDIRQEYNFIVGLYLRIKDSAKDISAIRLLINGREAESIGGHIDISRPIGGRV